MQEIVDSHIFGDEFRFPHDGVYAGVGRTARHGLQNVADVNDPDHVVHGVAVNRHSRVPGADQHPDQFLHGHRHFNSLDVQARDHDVLDVKIVHVADGPHHVNVVAVQVHQLRRG